METLAPEMTERIRSAFSEEKWGASIRFMDSINSLEELEAVFAFMKSNGIAFSDDRLCDCYKKWLSQWPDAKQIVLTPDFQEKFPFLASRVVDDESARVLLRAAEFSGADLAFFASIVEREILTPHVVNGKLSFRWPDLHGTFPEWMDNPRNKRCFVISTVAYYTQVQMWRFREVFMTWNGKKLSGGGGTGGVYIKAVD